VEPGFAKSMREKEYSQRAADVAAQVTEDKDGT
jgi:hypothetical protein